MTTEKETTTKQAISDSVLDELIAGFEKPEDLLGDDGLFKELKKTASGEDAGVEPTAPIRDVTFRKGAVTMLSAINR